MMGSPVPWVFWPFRQIFCSVWILMALALSPSISSMAAVPNIPPQVLSELKNMSPAEQARLAEQYNFDLPNTSLGGKGADEESFLGAAGEKLELSEKAELRLLEREIERIIEQDEKPRLEEQLRRYGLDLFNNEISTFAPVDDMPPPDGYRLGPGDTLNVFLFGREERDLVVRISRDGSITLPKLGAIFISGLSFEEARVLISAKVESQLVGTRVVISVGKLRAINVVLAGEVIAPGNYSLSGLTTVLQALFAGGGITDLGGIRDIGVMRNGKQVANLDVYDILLRGDSSGDVRLKSGDTVFVPIAEQLVSIDGEVKRPAIYEVLPNETLGDVVNMSGGVSSVGYSKSAFLERRIPGSSSLTRLQVDLSKASDLERRVLDGDSLFVAALKPEATYEVTLRGAVSRPGKYGWFEGQKLSDLLANIDQDLLDETDTSIALVVRREGAGKRVTALSLDLKEAISNHESPENLLLQNKDEVLVFALPQYNRSFRKLKERSDDEDEDEDEEFLADVEGDDDFGPERADNELSVEQDSLVEEIIERIKEEDETFEDRMDLIEELVARLETQAETPSVMKVVELAGQVRMPGRYPLVENGGIADLISLAGGFSNSAYTNSVEVTRIQFTRNGEGRISAFDVALDATVGSQTFELKPQDQILIGQMPRWSYGDSVELSGAVMFPGKYPVVPGEMLSSVLERAGGLGENSFPEGAVLIKIAAKKREQEQLQRLISTIRRNAISQSITRERESAGTPLISQGSTGGLEILEKILEDDAGGRVVIDLPAIKAGVPSADIQLEAGDSLYIPHKSYTVAVIGEVRQPGTFQYGAELEIADYIDLAAGSTVRADVNEIYVVRANGGVERTSSRAPLLSFVSKSDKEVRAGDTIVVPVDEEYQPVLTKYREISTVVFQSIASIYPFFRN